MANIGMSNLKYAIMSNLDGSYGTPKSLGGAISASVSLNVAEASLYSDDQLTEYASSFQSASVSLTVDNDNDKTFAKLLGKNMDEISGIVSSSIKDLAPYVGFGYIVSRISGGVQEWRAQFFQKVRFKPFVPESSTKGESLEFKTVSIEGLAIPNSAGVWESHGDFATEEEALMALENFFAGGE